MLRFALICLAFAWPQLTQGSDARDCQAIDLQSLLAASAIEPPRAVRFREERHNPMFQEPLVLEGTLEYLGPGMLRKSVESPFQEQYLVEPDRVTITRGDEQEVLEAGQGRMIAAFLSGIESLLAGDAERLEETFEYCIEGSPAEWTLSLEPRARRLARHLSGMHVEGGGGAIERIRIDLDDAEWHVMEILADPPAGTQ